MFEGEDILKMDEEEIRQIRGNKIGMIFQEPMTSLNPVLTIGRQLTETLELHLKMDKQAATSARHRAARDGRHPGGQAARSTTTRTSSPAACASA